MHRCVKKIRFFLILLVVKAIALSAVLMKIEATEKKIPHYQALKEFNTYLTRKIKQKNIRLPKRELEKLAAVGRVVITAHGDQLTKKQFSKIKRNLRDYLKVRFPTTYKKGSKQQTNIYFRFAKQAIKARIIDHLMRSMKVTNSNYQKMLWHTVRGFVMHQLYEKSYFDERSGGLVVDYADINTIFTNTRKLLNSYNKQLPAKAYDRNVSNQQKHLPKKLDENEKTKKYRHLISREKAARFVNMIIKRSGIAATEHSKLFTDIMAHVDARLKGNKIDHYTMKKLAHDEIKKYEDQLKKLTCTLCNKRTSGANRKIFDCQHVYHKTCLYKNFGTVEFLKSWRGSKKCPVCIKNSLEKTGAK